MNEKKRRGLRGPRRWGIQRDAAAISRCSGRHAVDPWLTNKDGKQDAKEDDDEHEIEHHESDRDGPLRTTTVLPPVRQRS